MTFVLQGKKNEMFPLHFLFFIKTTFYLDVGDKLIEVVGVQSAIHAGSIYAGVRSSAKRLGQCSRVVIR